MRLAEAMGVGALQRARVVAGGAGLDREVNWVHVVELPDPLPWLREGHLLLTTGYAWPRDEAGQRALLRSLAERRLAGVGLAVPHFFERAPAAALAVAEESGLPLLEIPWEIPFAQITEELHGAILAEQYRVIERSEAIHRELTRAALEANSLQDLAEALGPLIGRSVTIEDLDGHLLAFHQIGEAADPVRRSTLERGQSPGDILPRLQQRGYLTALHSATRPVRIPALPDMGMAGRLVCPIRMRDETAALLWIIEGVEPLSDLDVRAAEHAAIVAALHISHQRAIAAREVQLGHSILDALLAGELPLAAPAVERARLLGFDPGRAYRAGLLLLDGPIPLTAEALARRERLAEALRRRLRELDAPDMLAVSHGQVVFLLPEGRSPERLWEALAGPDLALAVGRSRPGLAGVRQGYAEIRELVPHLRAGRLHRYEDMLLPRVLLGDGEARRAFLGELLGPLRRARNGEVLLATLVAVARSGFQLKAAAGALCVHPKTLRYRLDRAVELGGFDLADPETRFKIELAARILSLEDKN